MLTPSEELELSSPILRGATVSIDYHNAQTILRTEQRNPSVVFEVYAGVDGACQFQTRRCFLSQMATP